jgi:hypothetical protein
MAEEGICDVLLLIRGVIGFYRQFDLASPAAKFNFLIFYL